jgi:hypothetical protein
MGVTVISRTKHTLNRELASQADSFGGLMMLESLRNDPHQLFSLLSPQMLQSWNSEKPLAYV